MSRNIATRTPLKLRPPSDCTNWLPRCSMEIAIRSSGPLLLDLASRSRVTYSLKTDKVGPTFQQVPSPTPLQAKAYELLNLLPVVGN